MKIPVFILFLMLMVMAASGANHYVLQGSAGAQTGASWTDAYTNIPYASMVRGDTYYLGAGNYLTNGAFFGEGHENTDNALTYVKKATLADHGTSTGWSDSYTNLATIGPCQFFNSGWVIDGQIRGGPTNGYGLAIWWTANGPNLDFGGSGNYHSQSNTVRYCEIKGSGLRDGTTQDRGIQFVGPGGAVNGCTLEYNYIHDQDNCSLLCRDMCNFMVQQNYITRNHYTDAAHSEALSISGTCTNVTARFNQWIDCEGTALICTPTTGHPGCAGPSIQNWYIYGNVVAYTSWGIANSGGFGDGIVYLFDTQAHGDMMIYNNTVANINHAWDGTFWCDNGVDSPACADHFYVRNNLFENNLSSVDPISGNVTDFKWDHNAYFTQTTSDSDANAMVVAAVNPFVDTNADWHLTLPTISGVVLPSPFNTDMDGINRGSDGVPDRGAYEFSSHFATLTVGVAGGKATVAIGTNTGTSTLTFY